MRTRVLEPSEWADIRSEGLPALLPYVAPQNIDIIAVEEDSGEIIAHVAAMRVTHFEGLWISPEYRGNAGVFRSLIREAYAIPRGRQEGFAFGGAEDGDGGMDTLCTRLGGKRLPMRLYAISVGLEDASISDDSLT